MCECGASLWTLEEGDGDVTYSLVVVHLQSYDGSCTLSLKSDGRDFF